jgi:hypothetical protein
MWGGGFCSSCFSSAVCCAITNTNLGIFNLKIIFLQVHHSAAVPCLDTLRGPDPSGVQTFWKGQCKSILEEENKPKVVINIGMENRKEEHKPKVVINI